MSVISVSVSSTLPKVRIIYESVLGGVVVSVLATGTKGCGFEPGHGDGFF
jgi:hypothetical protein